MTIDKHIDETKLELYILNSPTLTDERIEIEAHLAECNGCKELYDNIAQFYTEVKNDLASSENLPMPKPVGIPARRLYPLEQKYQNLSPFQRFAVSVPLRMARWIVRHPYAAGGATLMFSSFIIAALITMFKPTETKPRDMNPTIAEFKGEMMIVENKYGEKLDEINIGKELAIRYEYMKQNFKDIPVTFYDVDKDGVNEVIWAQSLSSKTGNAANIAPLVTCKSIKNHLIMWKHALQCKLNFPKMNDHFDNDFTTVAIAVGDYDADGVPEVYILASHADMFPNFIRKLNAIDGKEIGTYIHVGGLSGLKFVDLNNDGVTEIITGGVNNAFNNACLIILDPRFISGHSPSSDYFSLADCPPAKEYAYVRIPKTIIGQKMQISPDRNSTGYIDINEDEKIIKVQVADQTGIENPPILLFDFGFDLTVKNIRTHDFYDKLAKDFYQKGIIKQIPDTAYFEEFKKECMYWDGTNWQNYPVQNKYYFEVTKKLQTPS